jgi:hypothetical protein
MQIITIAAAVIVGAFSSITYCCGATLLPFEVLRRRHNRLVRDRMLTP